MKWQRIIKITRQNIDPSGDKRTNTTKQNGNL